MGSTIGDRQFADLHARVSNHLQKTNAVDMAAREESTRNETADIKLNRAPFSLRCGDEAHPHDVLIPPWRNQPHSANCAPSCWRTAHIIRFVPPHHSRRSPFISSSRPRFLSPRFVSSVASASYTERRSHVGNGGVLRVVSVSVIFTASLDALNNGALVCPLRPEIVHGCVRQRAGPPPVCRSRARIRSLHELRRKQALSVVVELSP